MDGGDILSSLSNLKKNIGIAPNPVLKVGLLITKGSTKKVLVDVSNTLSFSTTCALHKPKEKNNKQKTRFLI